MIYKKLFIIFCFFISKINIFSICCNCCNFDKNNNLKIDKNNNLKIDNNESNINNNLKDEKSKDNRPKKEDDKEKNNVNYRKSKIKFINGKCGYQILLLTLCNLFKDKDDILDDFENCRNLKDDSPENRDFLRKIAEIVKKYKNSTDNNQIDVDDFIKVYLISLIYNCKKINPDEINTNFNKVYRLCQLFICTSSSFLKRKFIIVNPNTNQKFDYNKTMKKNVNSLKEFQEYYKNFDYKNIEANNLDNYSVNYISVFLYYLYLIYSKNIDLDINNNPTIFEIFNYKGFDFNKIKNSEIFKNKEFFLITFNVHDGYFGHICAIYKQNDKYWFCCCNKEIEVSYDDIINQRFQKIIDDWKNIKEFETYNYKFQHIFDYICIS